MSAGRCTLTLVALYLIAPTANASAQDGVQPTFLDSDGETVPFTSAYEQNVGPEHAPSLLRTIGWELGLLGVGTTWYWYEKDFNAADWDFPPFWDRFNGKAIRFDDNDFTTNTVGHPVAGMGYYAMARINGLSVWESSLAAFVTSAGWEWGLEWREQVSINDQVFTPVGGIPLGEFVHQLGDYLSSAPGGGESAHDVAAVTLGFPRWLHDRWDGPAPDTSLPPDELGLSSAFWHRFHLAYEASQVRDADDGEQSLHSVVIDAELVRLPGYRRPGSFDVGYTDGNFSELRLRAGISSDGWGDLDVRASTNLAGYYTQDFEEGFGGRMVGHGANVGLNVAFRHTDSDLLGNIDQIAIAHVAGPAAQVHVASAGANLSLSAEAHGDFSSIHSLAYGTWLTGDGTQGLRSVLVERGYYNALGVSGRLAAELEYRGLQLGADVSYGAYRSIEGLDREQDSVTRDIPMHDELLEYALWAGYTWPVAPLHIRIGTAGSMRTGTMEETVEQRDLTRVVASAGLRF